MKNKIKDFLFKKRIKLLRNKKGFSLIEVLVAVAIIGIISAIAYPVFDNQMKEAAKVAANTSATNMAKAFKNCVVLKSFSQCNSLDALKITCPSGSQCEAGGTSPDFCAHVKNGEEGSDFNVCVHVDNTTGKVTTKYGGALIGTSICHVTETDGGNCDAANDGDEYAVTGNIECTQTNIVAKCGQNVDADDDANTCGKTYSCKIPTTDGECDKDAGTCS